MTMAAPPRRGASRALGLLRFAASVVISLVLLVGVPVALRAIAGNPLDRLPDVLAGDMSSGVVLAVLVAVLWVAWAQFVVAFVVELVAALRRAPVPARIRLPGFGVQQGLARALISGALLLAPVATTTIAPAAAVMAMPPAAAAAVAADSIPGQASSVSAPAGAVLTLTSDGARTWWDLATEHLGDGTQWRQLWDVNAGRVQADGTVMQSATTPLQIGWTVQLPAGVSAPAAADGAAGPGKSDVTVEPGQTLSQIAEDHGQAWQDLWSANSGRVQPDGGVLNDPDYVEPGWVITIPAPPEDSPQASLPGHDTVTVRPGQTLGEIAAAHGTDVAAVMAANVAVTQADGDRLADPDVIETGWVLQIPGASADAPPTQQSTPADAGPLTTTPPSPGIGMPSADPGAAAPDATDSAPTAQAPAVDAAPPAQQPTAADVDPSATAQLAPGIGMPSADPGGAPTASDVTSSVTGTAPASIGALAPAGQASDDVVSAGQDDSSSSVSAIALFTGAGALFAALLLAALMRRRARQRGHRLPGELPGAHPGELVDVERVLRAAGAAAAADAQWLDEALHGLGQLTAASGDGVLPDVLAVAVTADQLRLVLAAPSTATVGAWQVRDEGRQWVLARQAATGYDAVTRDALMPPFPTLVTVGATDSGEHWLLDLERIGALTVTGDPVRSADLARFMAAELAHNSWSELLQVTLVGIGAEMADMYPERLTYADDSERALASATAQLRSITQNDAKVLTGRTAPVGGEAFAAHVVLINPSAVADQAPVDELIAAVTDHRDRSTVALVVASGTEGTSTGQPAWEINVDREGMLTIPELGLQLRAQQLPQAEAGLLSRMMAMAAGPGRWVRPNAPDVIDSDVTPLPVTVDEATATTAKDHQVLTAPVPADVREHIVAGDAELNADLAQWADPASPYPRISFLGKVEVRPQGGASEPLPPLRAEVAVHLAVHSAGVSAERLTSDLWPTESSVDSRVRQHVYGLRKQLGANPSTGVEYLPRDRSGRYRLDGGVLIDGELFRRLRLRASIRDDEHLRVQDWWQALDLVRGIPFSGGRRDGYTWLADQRIDEEYQALIVDIAHQVATHHLSVGEPHRAEQAARRAMGAFDAAHAVPDICLLDMVWACDAQGRWAEGDSYVQRIIANYGTDIEDCPPRTFQILDRRQQQRAA